MRVHRIGWSLALLVTAAANALSAQGRALAIEDYYRLRTVGAPQLSPDGRWVAYTVSTRIEATNSDSSEVWLGATDGSSPPRRISSPATHATSPGWDDSGHLAFVAGGRRWSVNPVRPDSLTETSGVTQQAGVLARRLTSPDGKWTANVRNVPAPRRDRVYA